MNSEAHLSMEGAASVLTRPTWGPSPGYFGPGPRMWRGDRQRPSPQPFRRSGSGDLRLSGALVVLSLAAVALAPRLADAEERPDAAHAALLDEANALKEVDACDGALPLYETLARDAAPPVSWFARYNGAVCYELLARPDMARTHYSALVGGSEVPQGLLADALFRRALLDVVPGRVTAQAREDLARLRRLRTSSLDRALVDLQLARLDSLSGRDRAAFRRVLRVGRVLETAGDDRERDRRGAPLDWYRAEAAVVRGTLWRNRAAATPLSLAPRGRITQRIRARAEALAQAEGHYAVAAGLPSPWAPRALLDLGDAWREASEALAALLEEARAAAGKRPRDAALAALVGWLGPRVPAQFRKALDAWKLCIESSRVLGMGGDLAGRCQASIDAIVDRDELTPEGAR